MFKILEEEIGKATKVRGAFFLPMFSKSKLDFVVLYYFFIF